MAPVEPLLVSEVLTNASQLTPGVLFVAIGAGDGDEPAAVCLQWADPARAVEDLSRMLATARARLNVSRRLQPVRP